MRLCRRRLASRNGAVRKIWHRVTHGRRKRADLIPIQTELRNRVNRAFYLSLGSVAVSERDEVLFSGIVILSQTNRQIRSSNIRAGCRRRALRDLLKGWNG